MLRRILTTILLLSAWTAAAHAGGEGFLIRGILVANTPFPAGRVLTIKVVPTRPCSVSGACEQVVATDPDLLDAWLGQLVTGYCYDVRGQYVFEEDAVFKEVEKIHLVAAGPCP